MRSRRTTITAMVLMVSAGVAADAQTVSPDLSVNMNATSAAWAPTQEFQAGVLTVTQVPNVPKREVALQASVGGLSLHARSGGATYIRNLGENLALEAALAVGAGSRYAVTDGQVVLADERSRYGMVGGQLRITDAARPFTFWTVGAMREFGAVASSDGAARSGLVLGWGLRTPMTARCCGFRLDLQAIFADRGPDLGGRIAFGATLRLD